MGCQSITLYPSSRSFRSPWQVANTHRHSWWRDARSNLPPSQELHKVTLTELKSGSLDPQSYTTIIGEWAATFRDYIFSCFNVDIFLQSLWECAWPSLYLFSNTWIVSCRCSFFDCSLLFTISNIVQALFKSLRSFSIFSYDASSFLRFCKNKVKMLNQMFKFHQTAQRIWKGNTFCWTISYIPFLFASFQFFF